MHSPAPTPAPECRCEITSSVECVAAGSSTQASVDVELSCTDLPVGGARAHVNVQDETLSSDFNYNFAIANAPPASADERQFDATGFDAASIGVSVTDNADQPLFCWIIDNSPKKQFPLDCANTPAPTAPTTTPPPQFTTAPSYTPPPSAYSTPWQPPPVGAPSPYTVVPPPACAPGQCATTMCPLNAALVCSQQHGISGTCLGTTCFNAQTNSQCESAQCTGANNGAACTACTGCACSYFTGQFADCMASPAAPSPVPQP